MKKLFVTLLLILFSFSISYSQTVFTNEKIKEIVLLNPSCDDEGNDYENGFVVIERKKCNKKLNMDFNEIMSNKNNIYPWDENVLCYCAFLPDVCVKCENVDIFIEFSTKGVVLKYSDKGQYDYILSQEGYIKLLEWCISVFPNDEFLKKFKNINNQNMFNN